MALQLTLSCDENNTDNGPTLIHSTDVQDYKISPKVIRILQESLTNDLISDHTEGVLCQAAPQLVLDILRRNGFSLQEESNDDGKTVWIVLQDGNGDAEKPDDQKPASNDDNEGDAKGEDPDGDAQGEEKE